MTRLWTILIKRWLLSGYVFSGFSALPIRLNGVAVTVQSRCRYGAIASPLRCNRDAVTVQSYRRYGVIATRLHRNGKHFWQKTDCRHCQRAEGYPFSALIAPVSMCLILAIIFYNSTWAHCAGLEQKHVWLCFCPNLFLQHWLENYYSLSHTWHVANLD